MRTRKLNFAPLRKVMDQIDDNGKHGRCGNWYMGLGGYDHGYGIYYKGQEIGRVNYEYKEYELYHEDFMPKELIPEFLAAIDARGFKDVGYHEGEDENFDDDGPRYVQESRKQIMWAINFRNMHTAVHGLFYGKDKKRVEDFANEIEYIEKNADWDWDEKQYAWESLYEDYPDIATMDEFNYRDIVDLPGGYEGIEDGDTIYRFVNRTSIDVYNESRDWEEEEDAMNWKFEIRNRKELDELYGIVRRSTLDWSAGKEWLDKLKGFYTDGADHWELEINGKKKLDRFYAVVDLGKILTKDDRADKFLDRLEKLYDEMKENIDEKPGVVKEADEGYDSDTPKIYVGTYAKYNDGSIDGKWITISDYNTYEEFVDACRELHSDEDDPEFMVQDYENFPEKWYHEGGLPTEEEFNKINEYYMMDDSRKEAYEVFVNHTGLDSIEDFEEAYEGQFNSPQDFGYYCVDTFGIPENPEYYIDYEAFGRDLTMDWHQGDPDETDAEGEPEDPDYYYDNDGYQQMEYGSDREVGEQYIDDVGLDSLGTDTLNNYFDYEAFGRDLLINDFWEDSGYIFREI